jgi:hypothetical protein
VGELTMPWTRKQVKYLLSDKVSPLSAAQKAKMKRELHANPAMGHEKKGSKALNRAAKSRVKRTRAHGLTSTRRGNQHMTSETHAYHY